MFPLIKLQQLHTEPLGFSQCKVVQAKLPFSHTARSQHGWTLTSEHPEQLREQFNTSHHSQPSCSSSRSPMERDRAQLPSKRQHYPICIFLFPFHWGIHSEGKTQIIQQPMNQHSMAQAKHWSCNFNCQELQVGLELPIWPPTKEHSQFYLSSEYHKFEVFPETEVEVLLFYFEKKQASDTDFFEVQVQEQPSTHFSCSNQASDQWGTSILSWFYWSCERTKTRHCNWFTSVHWPGWTSFLFTHTRRVLSG